MWNHLIQFISHLCICGFLSVYWRGKNVLFIDTILCCAWKVGVFINVFMQKSKQDVNCSFPLLFLMSFWSLQTKWVCILPLYNALKFSAVVYEYSTLFLDSFEFLFCLKTLCGLFFLPDCLCVAVPSVKNLSSLRNDVPGQSTRPMK